MLKVAVLGLGRFGSSVAVELSRLGAEVLAVDRSLRLVEGVSNFVAEAESFDATDANLLTARGIGKMDVAVVAVGDFEAPRILEEVRALFADAEPGKAFRNRPAEPEQTALRTALLRRPFERA
mgnify:CR=1 FL=1